MNRLFILFVIPGSGWQVHVMDAFTIQAFLRKELSQIQTKNPNYSVRAFSKKLGMAVGTISEVLSGKRELSVKSVNKILDRLQTGPAERARLLRAPKQALSFDQAKLEADQYFILSEWYYLAILSLVRTKNLKSSPSHIAERLGISLTTASQAIDRLIRANLIQLQDRKYVRTKNAIQTTDTVQDLAIRKAHFQNLDRIRQAMEEHPFGSFDVSSLTFAFAPEKMAEAKARIRQFQDEFANEFSTDPEATEVYRLSNQLFSLTVPNPLTTPGKKS